MTANERLLQRVLQGSDDIQEGALCGDKFTKLDVESLFVLDAQIAMDMLDSPPEPNENLIELLRMK